MAFSGVALNIQNAVTLGLTKMESPCLRNRHGTKELIVKLPRLKIRKNTRAILAGLMIAVASLWALAMAYDEARNNMFSFFLSTVVLIVIVLICAIAVVAVLYGIKRLIRLVRNNDERDY